MTEYQQFDGDTHGVQYSRQNKEAQTRSTDKTDNLWYASN